MDNFNDFYCSTTVFNCLYSFTRHKKYITTNIIFFIYSQLAAIKTKKMYTHSNFQVNLLLCSVFLHKTRDTPFILVWTQNLSWTFATICMGSYFFTTFFPPESFLILPTYISIIKLNSFIPPRSQLKGFWLAIAN